MSKIIKPSEFCSLLLKEPPYKKQAEIMDVILEHPRLAVAAANGVGKTWAAARIAFWFFVTFQQALVVTTAPSFRQVRYLLWRELQAAVSHSRSLKLPIGGRLTSSSWVWKDKLALGFTAVEYKADRFQGLHSPNMLVIVDEASGLNDQIYEQILASLRGSNSVMLMIGNPLVPAGPFYDAFKSTAFKTFRLTAFDCPNVKEKKVVIPGLVTWEDVERDRQNFGEDSPYWKTRILADFPESADNALFSLADIEAAGEIKGPGSGTVEVGVDVGRGGNYTVIVAKRGNFAFLLLPFKTPDLMSAVGKVAEIVKTHSASTVKIDSTGVGAGVADRLRELLPSGVAIYDINGGEAATKKNFSNRRTEIWVELAEKVRAKQAGGPVFHDKRLARDLLEARFKITSSGKIALESARTVSYSPDFGDALAIAFAEVGISPTGPEFELSASDLIVTRARSPWGALMSRRDFYNRML